MKISKTDTLFQLTVIHPKLPASAVVEEKSAHIDIQVQPKSSHLKHGVHGVQQAGFNLVDNNAGNFLDGSNQSNITAMIVVVCVGLMIAFLVLGIIRLRAVHNR